MMTRIERLGARLADLIRREHDLSVEREDVKRQIDEEIHKIRSEPEGTLYEMTSEQPLVRPYVPEDAGETLRIVLDEPASLIPPWLRERIERSRNDRTVGMPDDHW